MATPQLSPDLLTYFIPFFTFLLVFAITYSLITWSKMFGSSSSLHGMIAVIIGLFVAFFSKGARSMIEFMVPWFTILMIFFVFLLLVFRVFGATDADFKQVITKHTGTQYTIIVIAIIIALGALSNAFGDKMLAITTPGAGVSQGDSGDGSGDGSEGTGSSGTATGSIEQNIGATFYHPKVLGTLFLLIVAAVAIRTISAPDKIV